MKKEKYFENYSSEVQNLMKGAPILLPLIITFIVSVFLISFTLFLVKNDNLIKSKLKVCSILKVEKDGSYSDTIQLISESVFPFKVFDNIIVNIQSETLSIDKEIKAEVICDNFEVNNKNIIEVKILEDIEELGLSGFMGNIMLEADIIYKKSGENNFEKLFITGNN